MTQHRRDIAGPLDPDFKAPSSRKKRPYKSFNAVRLPDNGGDAHPEWNLRIPGQGRARSSIAVNFAGTSFHPTLSLSDDEKNKQAQENKEMLEKAIFILSQSPTGRAALEEMTREGYKIIFDDVRTGQRGAGGLCDASDKTLVLQRQTDPEYLALLIGHEAVHAVQNTRYDLFPSTRHRPEIGIRMSFAIEADAYAQQTQIALELAHGDPSGPKDQVYFPGAFQQFARRFPRLAAAAQAALQKDEHLEDGTTCAAAFEAFYDDAQLRSFYEDAHVSWAFACATQMQNQGRPPSKARKDFTAAVESGWIKSRLRNKGVPYLERHAPKMDFNDPRYAGITLETEKKIKLFYERFLPGKAPDLKTYGTHVNRPRQSGKKPKN